MLLLSPFKHLKQLTVVYINYTVIAIYVSEFLTILALHVSLLL